MTKPRDATDQSILRTLATAKYRDIVDQRGADRGALWVITDRAMSRDNKFFEKLNTSGYNFRYSIKGSKATQHRAAWWWQPDDPEKAILRWKTALAKAARNRQTIREAIKTIEAKNGVKFDADTLAQLAAESDSNNDVRAVLLEFARNRRKRGKRSTP